MCSAEAAELAQGAERQVRSGLAAVHSVALPLPAHSERQVLLLLAYDSSQLSGKSDANGEHFGGELFLLPGVSSSGERGTFDLCPFAD